MRQPSSTIITFSRPVFLAWLMIARAIRSTTTQSLAGRSNANRTKQPAMPALLGAVPPVCLACTE